MQCANDATAPHPFFPLGCCGMGRMTGLVDVFPTVRGRLFGAEQSKGYNVSTCNFSDEGQSSAFAAV